MENNIYHIMVHQYVYNCIRANSKLQFALVDYVILIGINSKCPRDPRDPPNSKLCLNCFQKSWRKGNFADSLMVKHVEDQVVSVDAS